jgi:hypothetical protein
MGGGGGGAGSSTSDSGPPGSLSTTDVCALHERPCFFGAAFAGLVPAGGPSSHPASLAATAFIASPVVSVGTAHTNAIVPPTIALLVARVLVRECVRACKRGQRRACRTSSTLADELERRNLRAEHLGQRGYAGALSCGPHTAVRSGQGSSTPTLDSVMLVLGCVFPPHLHPMSVCIPVAHHTPSMFFVLPARTPAGGGGIMPSAASARACGRTGCQTY